MSEHFFCGQSRGDDSWVPWLILSFFSPSLNMAGIFLVVVVVVHDRMN